MDHNGRRDYLKEYNVFNIVLFIWILFLPVKNTVYQISTILMIVFLLTHLYIHKTHQLLFQLIGKTKDIFIALLIVMLCMFISSVLGLSPLENIIDLVKFFYRYVLLLVVLLYFYYFEFFSKKRFLSMIIITLSIYCLDGLYQYFTHYDLFLALPLSGHGLTGPMFNRNIFGFIMAINTSILFYILMEKYSHISRLSLIGLIILFFVHFFTLAHSMSRASWLFFGIFFFLYTMTNIKKILSNKLFIVSIICLITISVFLFNSDPHLKQRLYLLIAGADSNRFRIWASALPLIESKFFFGYGVGSFAKALGTTKAGMHNFVLEILLFLGIFGLMAYSYLLWIVFKTIYLIKQFYLGFFLIAFLTLLQFDGSLVNSKLDVSVFIIILFFVYSHVIGSKTTYTHQAKVSSK